MQLHAVNPSMSLSGPTTSPLQEQMREDYATGLMGAQRDLLQQNPSGLGRQEQEIGREPNSYTPREPAIPAPGSPTSSPPSERQGTRAAYRSARCRCGTGHGPNICLR